MSEQRKKSAQVCVKNGANGNGTVEIFPASEWGGPDGLYRLRYRRRWIDGTHGDMRFYTAHEVGALVASLLFDANFCAENSANEVPKNMTYKTRVSVPNGRDATSRDVTTIATEQPLRGADGHWYVGAHIIGRGVVMVPCDDVIIKECKEGRS